MSILDDMNPKEHTCTIYTTDDFPALFSQEARAERWLPVLDIVNSLSDDERIKWNIIANMRDLESDVESINITRKLIKKEEERKNAFERSLFMMLCMPFVAPIVAFIIIWLLSWVGCIS